MSVCETCVVCGEASAELICRACHALIGAKPLRVAEACETTRRGAWTPGGTSWTERSSTS
jgi:hypothetical protein